MIILGLNAYHGNASACVLVDGKLVAATEEERFNRIKNWAGLPVEAVKYCLQEAGVSMSEVNHIAVNRNPKANAARKALFTLTRLPSPRIIGDRLKNASRIGDLTEKLSRKLNTKINANLHHVEHHMAHMASAFFVSSFEEAAVVSIDGFGDFVGAMWGTGAGNRIKVNHRTFFPHSLGLFYLAFTQYLGFLNYGDEYKVMGLAPYGKPRYLDKMRLIVKTDHPDKMLFKLDLTYFRHHNKGVRMNWEAGIPTMGPVYAERLEDLFGPPRKEGEDITQHHKDIAHSLQKRYEEVFFEILNHVYEQTKYSNLSLAGGCAMNSVANGKIFQNTPFREVYIQPAAGDAGGAIGAACYVWNQLMSNKRAYVLNTPYLGPEFKDEEIAELIEAKKNRLQGFTIMKMPDKSCLCRLTAEAIAEGSVVGWFQGRLEWGSRALGNRSILADPRRSDMKDVLNAKIKRRESFRPFAPSILLESVADYFETRYPAPFMQKVYKIKEEKRSLLPAITHVDGTGRLQTVSKDINPLYWQLINEFRNLTGIPVLLNTSFNENEPIVCRPEEALDCFLRTNMDILVLGQYLIKRV